MSENIDFIGKPLTSAVIAGGATSVLMPNKVLNVYGYKVPLPVAVGAAVGVGSILAEVAHQHIFPNIHVGNKLEQPLSSLMAGGVNAGAAAGVLYAMNPGSLESLGFGKVIAAGFIADAGADYIYYNLAKPMLVGK